MPDAKTSIQL
jgi:hypothetical protein